MNLTSGAALATSTAHGGTPLRSGAIVCLGGPDGTGKSTLAAALTAACPGSALHRYWRPGLLPMLGTLVGRRLDGRTNSDPHGRVQSGRLKSVVWTVYYFIDFVAGHWLVLRPATRQGKLVVIERGWDDMRADPRRYGLRGTRLTRLLTPLVPRPDITVVLNAPSDVVQARKCELPTGEIERQLEVWRSYGRSRRATLLVDARRSVEDLTAEILAATSHNATHR